MKKKQKHLLEGLWGADWFMPLVWLAIPLCGVIFWMVVFSLLF